MESPNPEYRGFDPSAATPTTRTELEQLSDQYKSMKELLKIYGLNVAEGLIPDTIDRSNKQKETDDDDDDAATTADQVLAGAADSDQKSHLLLHPVIHPAELLRSAFTEQLSNHWLELCQSSNNTGTNPSTTHHRSNHNRHNVVSNDGGGSSDRSGTPTRIVAGLVEESSTFPDGILKRFESPAECGEIDCALQQLRDHYHCEDRYCVREVAEQQPGRRFLKTFNKKEEIVRHCKWHKKRTETLKFGFLRFSCLDDCKLNGFAAGCQFNGKQTHYHCIEAGCDKVYISTSDVQMHANYHRKTNAIKMQGFLRVRNLETCQEPSCPYANQQTTHFHCLRDGCQFTFKNKGEMEKHKVYHLKDEQLLSDGFKKFFKADKCKFANCRYDGKLNHIHCIRTNCNYVFHSSGQLTSHKRKHEKAELSRDVSSSAPTAMTSSTSDNEGSSVSVDCHLLDLSVGSVRGEKSSNQMAADEPNNTISLNQLHRRRGVQTPTITAGPPLPLLNAQLANHMGISTPHGAASTNTNNNNILQITSIDGLFNRKRGRPPKNRFVEVYNATDARTSYSPDKVHSGSMSSKDSPQAIFASFKLDRSVTGRAGVSMAAPASNREGSPGSVKKKAKLMDQNLSGGCNDTKPVVGLIKSTGIFFPNTAREEDEDEEKNCDSTSSESNGGGGGGGGSQEARKGYGECDEEEWEEEEQNNGNIDSSLMNVAMNPFNNSSTSSSHHRNNQQHHRQPASLPNQSFVPSMFPINTAAIEHNNRDGAVVANGIPNFGMEWLKYAYQQPNPLMMFATTAALLAASMNPMEPQIPPVMDPTILEYAKNMFLYNNFQQHLTGVGGMGSGLAGGSHVANGLQSVKRDSLLGTGTSLDGGGGGGGSAVNAAVSESDGDFPRSSSGMSNFAKDETIPTGYLKFRFNEDCQFAMCGYRNHQSHFHCLRDNCYYSFCDKTRFVQHTARHERLDKLMGNDFKQFRSNMNCGHEGCEFMAQSNVSGRLTEDDDNNAGGGGSGKVKNSSKSSHFHCQKCDYICTDTNKVVAHRRQHNKTDFIRLSGFRKVASSEQCFTDDGQMSQRDESSSSADHTVAPFKCHYSGKQTHYHCLVCNSVVLNRSQLTVHRHKGQPK